MTAATSHAHVPESFTVGPGAPVFVETATHVPIVHITVSFRSGSFHDPPEKEGATRMMMRLLRRGADGLGAQEIERRVDALGADLAVEASTSSVSVQGSVIKRNVEPFVDLIARVIGKPTFADEEMQRLGRETIAELEEARDNDRHLASVAFRRAIFGDHPFGRGSAGRISSVKRIERADVVRLYEKHLTRGNAVFGFAGDIDAKLARTLADKLVSALREGPSAASAIPEPAPLTGRRLVFVDKPERTQTQIFIGGLGTHPRDPDHVALAAAVAIFGGTFTSRLMREIRSKRGWSYGASARIAIERARHAFQMWTFPAATDAAACAALELELLEQLVGEGVSAKEAGFIKRYLTRSHAFDVDTAQKRLHQALDIVLLDLPADYHSAYLAHVAAATDESMNAAVKARISSQNLVVAVVGTQSDIFDAVREKITGLDEAKIVRFDED